MLPNAGIAAPDHPHHEPRPTIRSLRWHERFDAVTSYLVFEHESDATKVRHIQLMLPNAGSLVTASKRSCQRAPSSAVTVVGVAGAGERATPRHVAVTMAV